MPVTYTPVGWQADDEITYQKLQQMSDNIQFLKDNYMSGKHRNLRAIPNVSSDNTAINAGPLGTTERLELTVPCTKIWAACEAFNIGLAAGGFNAIHYWVYWDAGTFTRPPVAVASMLNSNPNDGGNVDDIQRRTVACVLDDRFADHTVFILTGIEPNNVYWNGRIHAIMVGY